MSIAEEETFQEVLPFINSAIVSFLKTHSLSWDDARSTAYLAFCEGYRDYDPNRGMKFSSWIVTSVIRGMLLDMKHLMKFRNRQRNIDHDLLSDLVPDSEYGRSFEEFLKWADSRKSVTYVLKLIFDPPKKLQELLKEFKDESGTGWRIALRWYLQKERNWSLERIEKTFKRIKAKL